MIEDKYYLQSVEIKRDLSIGQVVLNATYSNSLIEVNGVFEHGEQIPTIVNYEGEEV